jgi:Sensors of blue-light using FAD
MPLSQLIYCSRVRDPSRLRDDVAAITASAIRRNVAEGITGCLGYSNDWFVQVIEGEHAAVQATFDRIGTDTRHHGLQVVMQREIKARSFPDWHMANVDLGRPPPISLAVYGAGKVFDPTNMPSPSILMMLMDLADEKRIAGRS